VATQTLTNFDAILKNVYRGPIVEQLNQESYAIDQFQRVAANDMGAFSGRKVIFPIHTGRNRGRAAITDGGVLPTAGTQSYQDGEVTIRYFAQGIELTDQVIKQSETNEGAFVRAMTAEIEGATTDLRKDINRQVYGTGDAILSLVTGTVASGTKTSIPVDSTQYIAAGDVVDLVASDGTVVNAAVTVSAVTTSGTAASSTQGNGSITIPSTSVGSALTGGSVRLTSPSSAASAAYPVAESDGFRNITATSGTLHGLSASSVPVWKGSEVTPGTAYSAPSEDLFIQLSQAIRKVSNKTPDVFMTSLGIQRRLANTYTSNKRWNDAKVLDVDGGYSAIMVAAGNKPVPVIADVDAPIGFAFGLRKDSFAWTELQKPDWLSAPDGKGSILTLKTSGSSGQRSATWQAWLGWYAALACTARNQNGRITQLADDNPVARI
jgi:hypothetical protein